MKNNDFKTFLFRTAVVTMACDGDIADSEIQLIKELANNEINFLGLDFENLLTSTVEEIKLNGKSSVNSFLQDLNNFQFSETQKLKIIDVCLAIINADSNIENSERNFLHLIIDKLNIDQETLIVEFPHNVEQVLNFENFGISTEFTDEIVFKD